MEVEALFIYLFFSGISTCMLSVTLTYSYTNNNSCPPILCKTGKNWPYFEWQWLCHKFHSCNQKVDGLISTKPQSWFRLEFSSSPLSPPPSPLYSSWNRFLRLWGPHVLAVLPVAWFHLRSSFHEQTIGREMRYWKVNVGIGSFSYRKRAFSAAWSCLSHALTYSDTS